MVRGEYWWVYYRNDGIDWSHRIPGDSIPVEEGSCFDVSDLPAPVGANLVICIPGEQVRIHKIKAPSRNRRRFLASLPYVIEDKLLHDTENYHLSPLTKDKKTTHIPVAIIKKSYLEELLKKFNLKEWRIKIVIPDFLTIDSHEPGIWTLDVSDMPNLLRIPGPDGGATLSGEIVQQPLGSLVLAIESAETIPDKLKVRVRDNQQYDLVRQWSDVLDRFKIKLEIHEDQRPRALWLSRFNLPKSNLNLLTGDYAPQKETKKHLLRLLPITGLAAALVLVSIIQWVVDGARIKSEYLRLNNEIEETYRAAFPDARNLVDPRFQMEQQLLKIRNPNNKIVDDDIDFLERLEQLASILSGNNNLLQTINYDGKMFEIEISVPDYESLERLQRQLSLTMEVNIENAELRDGRVHSLINIGT